MGTKRQNKDDKSDTNISSDIEEDPQFSAAYPI